MMQIGDKVTYVGSQRLTRKGKVLMCPGMDGIVIGRVDKQWIVRLESGHEAEVTQVQFWRRQANDC